MENYLLPGRFPGTFACKEDADDKPADPTISVSHAVDSPSCGSAKQQEQAKGQCRKAGLQVFTAILTKTAAKSAGCIWVNDWV